MSGYTLRSLIDSVRSGRKEFKDLELEIDDSLLNTDVKENVLKLSTQFKLYHDLIFYSLQEDLNFSSTEEVLELIYKNEEEIIKVLDKSYDIGLIRKNPKKIILKINYLLFFNAITMSIFHS